MMSQSIRSRLALVLGSLVAVAATQAQPAGGRPANEAVFRSRVIGQSDLAAAGASVSQSSLGFAAEIPFPIAGGVNGKLGASVDFFSIDFDGFTQAAPGLASPVSRGKLATLAPSVSFRADERVVVFAGPQWKLSAANGADTGDASHWGGTVGAIWFYRPGLTLVGGFVMSERPGYSTQYLPIAGFSWRIDDTWSLALTGNASDYQAPVLKLTRTLGPATRVFAQAGLERGYLRLAGNSSIPHGTLRYKAFVPQVGVEWQPSPEMEVAVFTGVQLNQHYDFKNAARQYVVRQSADGSWMTGLRVTGRF